MELTEPSDEASKYYCRQAFRNDNISTALVLVPNKENLNSSGKTTDLPKNRSRVEEMIQQFEKRKSVLKIN